MKKRKLIWPHFQASASFCMDDTGVYLNNKAFFISDPPFEELGFLNSKCGWFLLAHLARIKRGGYLEAEAQYVEQLPSITGENAEAASIRDVAVSTNSKAILKNQVVDDVLRRIPDLCPTDRAPKLTNRLYEWWKLDFKSFQAEIRKAFKAEIPPKQRNEWESFLREEGAKVHRLTGKSKLQSARSTPLSTSSSTSRRTRSPSSKAHSPGNIEGLRQARREKVKQLLWSGS